MRLFRFAGILFLCIFMSGGAFAQSQSGDVNEPFVQALKTYRLAMEQDGDQRENGLLQVLQLFGQVVGKFPDHRLAGLIKNRSIPNVNFDDLAPLSWNEGKRGIARDLLAAYENDIDTMRTVGDAAVYALLSAATYDHDEAGKNAKERARKLGWSEVDIPAASSFIVGGAKASLFTKGDQTVLAFRGSITKGDWVTNVGTIVPVPLAGEQVIDAISLAVALSEDHPNLILTGHSLGGRLAQASRFVTDRPTYVFNSAPVGLPELSVLGVPALLNRPTQPLSRFRHPQDQLSSDTADLLISVLPADDTVVKNFFEVPGVTTLNPFNDTTKSYLHNIGALHQAMENVRQAYDAGWLSAYLIGLPTTRRQNPTKPEVATWDGSLCRTVSHQLTSNELRSLVVGKNVTSQSTSGLKFTELHQLDGELSLTSRNDIRMSGRYSVEENAVCYDYDGRNEACLAVYICQSGEAPHVKVNPNGEQTALILSAQDLAGSLAHSQNYTAPDGYMWAQLASRRSIEEARAFASAAGAEARIFRTKNGWHAITGGLLFESESLANMAVDMGWPSDALLTRGESFIEELSLDFADAAPQPAFIHTKTLRATDVIWFSWNNGTRTLYDTRPLEQGEDVVVWGSPDEEGYCRGGGGDGAVIKCADLVAYASDLNSGRADDGVLSSIEFVFPKARLDRVARLSDDGELRSTGFNVNIFDKFSVNCTHWVTQGAGSASDYGITTWEALVPKLQCSVWSDNGDGSSGLVSGFEVSATYSQGTGALTMSLLDPDNFYSVRTEQNDTCDFSVQNQVFEHQDNWVAECPSKIRNDRVGGSTASAEVLSKAVPLLAGIYVNDPTACQSPAVTPEVFDRIIYINKDQMTRMDTTCSVHNATTEGDGVKIKSTCEGEGEVWDVDWTWYLLSNESFVDAGLDLRETWTRCASDDPLAKFRSDEKQQQGTTSAVQIAGQTCTPATSPVSRDTLLAWASKPINGTTASGANWSLNLRNLTTKEAGPAVFTNSKGEKTTGLWRPTEGQLCQSYNKGESWACHSVFSCADGEENSHAMQNSDGQFTSVINVLGGSKPAQAAGSDNVIAPVVGALVGLNQCDAIASNPYDVRNPSGTTTVAYDKLVASKNNIDTCLAALKSAEPSDLGRYNYLVARLYAKAGNDAQFLKHIRAADRENYPIAIYNLGRAYHDGSYGLNQDHRTAFGYYQRAISLGEPLSLLNTAWMHEWGQSRNVSIPSATRDYKKADSIFSEFGMAPLAANNLCRLEFRKHRSQAAKNWCEKAATAFPASKVRLDQILAGYTYAIDQCQSGGFSTMRNHQITIHVHGNEELRLPAVEDKYARLSWKLLQDGCDQRGNRKAVIMQRGQKQIEFSQGSTQPQRSGTWFFLRNHARVAHEEEQRRLSEQEQQARLQQAAREAILQKTSEVQALRVSVPNKWRAHMNRQFSGKHPIDNIVDLLDFDQPKAIGFLTNGVTLQLRTDQISLSGGLVFILDEHRPTDYLKPLREAEHELETLKSKYLVGQPLARVGRKLQVICRVDPQDMDALSGKVAADFEAKMQSLDGRSAVFDCTLKR